MSDTALPSFSCPVTNEVMREPVCTADGHTYERFMIEAWLAHNNTSPATGAILSHKELIPNVALRNAIQELQEAHAIRIKRSDIEFEPRPVTSEPLKTIYTGYLKGTGSADKTKVAVLKMQKERFQCDARVLLKVRPHPRLVRFIAEYLEGESQFLVTEFAAFGPLSACMDQIQDQLTLPHDIIIMQQVCQGMEHLATEGILHGDLAARTVLLFAFDAADPLKTSVKVSGFGLAITRSSTRGGEPAVKLDVRHTAPEALQKGKYSEKSDVWSFGVTAWELLTRGSIPYFEIISDQEMILYVCKGGRLARDHITVPCPDPMWQVLEGCWTASIADRPTFAKLVVEIGCLARTIGVDVRTVAEAPSEPKALTNELKVPHKHEPGVPPKKEHATPTKSQPTVPPKSEPTIPIKSEPTVPPQSEPTVPVKSELTVPTKSEPAMPLKSEPTMPTKSEPSLPTKCEPGMNPSVAPLAAQDDAVAVHDELAKVAIGKTAIACFAHDAQAEDELTFQEGDTFTILRDSPDRGWLVARDSKGKEGLLPTTHISIVGNEKVLIAAPKPSQSVVTAIHPYQAQNSDELTLQVGVQVKILGEAPDEGWYKAELPDGTRGIVPETHLDIDASSIVSNAGEHLGNMLAAKLLAKKSMPAGFHLAVAEFNYSRSRHDELSFQAGDIMFVRESEADPGWYLAELNGERGYAPGTHLVKM